MDNLTNVNREMADALRRLALAGSKPIAEFVNVPAALSKLGIECHRAEGELLIDRRDTLRLPDYIDRPVGDSSFAREARLYIAMSIRDAVADARAEEVAGDDILERLGRKLRLQGPTPLPRSRRNRAYRAQRRFLSDTLPQPMSTS